jgi:hypothetical protein
LRRAKTGEKDVLDIKKANKRKQVSEKKMGSALEGNENAFQALFSFGAAGA